MKKTAEAKQKLPELGDTFEDLRRICEEEDYILEIPPRQERPNPFPDALDELSAIESAAVDASEPQREPRGPGGGPPRGEDLLRRGQRYAPEDGDGVPFAAL